MWTYEKKLQYPVKIKNPNPKLAQIIISQLGGPDGEIGASMRYLHQRYSMPYGQVVGILTDVGTEELAHMEMVSAIIHQLTRNLSEEEIAKSPFATYFVDHTTGVYPVAASGVPYDMKYIGVKGDVIADLNEDLAAEQKARVTYDNILRLLTIPTSAIPLSFSESARSCTINASPTPSALRRRSLTAAIFTRLTRRLIKRACGSKHAVRPIFAPSVAGKQRHRFKCQTAHKKWESFLGRTPVFVFVVLITPK